MSGLGGVPLWCMPPSGGGSAAAQTVIGPVADSAADNAVARWDGITGALLQNSAVTISDVAGASVTLSSTPGNSLALAAAAPAAAIGASQAGKAISLTASAAVASTDTNGAAAGGSVTITAGAAARRVSGNANGGDVNIVAGAGIGTGVTGNVSITATSVVVPTGSGATAPGVMPVAGTDLWFGTTTGNRVRFVYNGVGMFAMSNAGVEDSQATNGGPHISFGTSASNTTPVWTFENDTDTGIGRAAANTLSLVAGGVEGARVNTVASAVNYVSMTPSAAASPVIVGAGGTDTDIDLALTPKGSGLVSFGALTGIGVEVLSGFISIKDAGGAIRKIAVIS